MNTSQKLKYACSEMVLFDYVTKDEKLMLSWQLKGCLDLIDNPFYGYKDREGRSMKTLSLDTLSRICVSQLAPELVP